MSPETIKALHRVIERQEEILTTSTPWTIRDQLRAFQEKLKTATNYNKTSEKPSEDTITGHMDTM